MTDSIQITTKLSGDSWTITGEVSSTGVLPKNIFIYENTGTAHLGQYVGVCNLDELKRIQVWKESATAIFGNRFVRSNHAKIVLSLDSDVQRTIDNLITTAKRLKTEMISVATTTTSYTL